MVAVGGDRGVVKLGVREVLEMAGVVCASSLEGTGLEGKVVVGIVEGCMVVCSVVVVVVVMSALLAVVRGFTVGADVRGSTAGGGG